MTAIKTEQMDIGAEDIVWAKSSDTGGLSVVRHICDVAAVAFELLSPSRWGKHLQKTFPLGMDMEDTRRWVAYLIACHDIGKATPGFQSKWEEGRQRVELSGLPFPPRYPDRHDAASGFLLKHKLLPSRGFTREDSALLADAVAAHHGLRIAPTEYAKFGRSVLPDAWSAVVTRIESVLAQVLGVRGNPRLPTAEDERAAQAIWLAGCCSVCDWIGSNESYFTHERERTPYKDWFDASRRFASDALADIGLNIAPILPQADVNRASLEAALGPAFSPRPLQLAVLDLVETLDIREPALFVIEAPMGEGKTEAAFAIDAALRQRCGHQGTYIAMPTQATSNALLGRFAEFIARLGLDGPAQLMLAHGAATLADLEVRLRDIGFAEENRSIAASAWLGGRKRTLLAQHAIGTVDQALVGVLNARHHFVRLFGLSNRLVVLDEVHAYDTYTGGLIERLLTWLKALGCSVVVMSATLPAARRDALIRAFGGAQSSLAEYPRVTAVSSGKTVVSSVPASRAYELDVVSCEGPYEGLADRAFEMAAKGADVLVVVNKVARAQEVYANLCARCADALLFHARYPMEDRLEREQEVLARFGKAAGSRGGRVLVATQVAEQSLDIDFDVLVTDLAPVDLLLQRAGRVHRHERHRPAGFERPRMYVAGLGESGPPDLSLSSKIYEDLPVLRSALWLRANEMLAFPDDIDRAVAWVYSEQEPNTATTPETEVMLNVAREEKMNADRRHLTWAQQAALPAPKDWCYGMAGAPIDDDDAAEGACRFGTRLGEDSVSCIPVFQLEHGFSIRGDTVDWSCGSAVPTHCARALSRRFIRISRQPLVSIIRRGLALEGWDQHPGLAAHVPLVLDSNGLRVIAGTHVHLDTDLGLIYERPQGE